MRTPRRFLQSAHRRFDLRRPKYTRNPRSLEAQQIAHATEQTHRANGTWEDYQAQQIKERAEWMEMATANFPIGQIR